MSISEGLRYKRYGECGRCGACCLTEDPPCIHLSWDGDKAICLVFEKPERCDRCLTFPQAPPVVFKTCEYYFRDTWEDDRVVKSGGDL